MQQGRAIACVRRRACTTALYAARYRPRTHSHQLLFGILSEKSREFILFSPSGRRVSYSRTVPPRRLGRCRPLIRVCFPCTVYTRIERVAVVRRRRLSQVYCGDPQLVYTHEFRYV